MGQAWCLPALFVRVCAPPIPTLLRMNALMLLVQQASAAGTCKRRNRQMGAGWCRCALSSAPGCRAAHPMSACPWAPLLPGCSCCSSTQCAAAGAASSPRELQIVGILFDAILQSGSGTSGKHRGRMRSTSHGRPAEPAGWNAGRSNNWLGGCGYWVWVRSSQAGPSWAVGRRGKPSPWRCDTQGGRPI